MNAGTRRRIVAYISASPLAASVINPLLASFGITDRAMVGDYIAANPVAFMAFLGACGLAYHHYHSNPSEAKDEKA